MVVIELSEGAVAPKRATDGSAGYDVFAHLVEVPLAIVDNNNNPGQSYLSYQGAVEIPAFTRVKVPLGFKATLPKGFVALVCARSGLAFKSGLVPVNAPGIVDEDYPGEWAVLLENRSAVPVVIKNGQAVAQVVFTRYESLDFEPGVVGQTTDRVGGFGSTDHA